MNHPSSIIDNRSGQNMDILGDGSPIMPVLVPTPGGAERCPLKEDGQCPAGCIWCIEFARELEAISR